MIAVTAVSSRSSVGSRPVSLKLELMENILMFVNCVRMSPTVHLVTSLKLRTKTVVSPMTP